MTATGNEKTVSESLPPPEESGAAGGVPFHDAALTRLRAALAEVIAAHPEVRSGVVVLDYQGNLNAAPIGKALWLGRAGAVVDPAAIVGGLENTLGVIEVMFGKLALLERELAKRATDSGAKILDRLEEAHDRNAAAAAKGAAPGPGAEAAKGGAGGRRGGGSPVARDEELGPLARPFPADPDDDPAVGAPPASTLKRIVATAARPRLGAGVAKAVDATIAELGGHTKPAGDGGFDEFGRCGARGAEALAAWEAEQAPRPAGGPPGVAGGQP